MRFRTQFRGAVLAIAASCCFAATSFAACTNDPDAAAKAVNFLSNPSSLLNGPNGARSSAEIGSDVRDFVAANPQALPAVIALLKGASVEQQQAIGTGLGTAADICRRPDLNFAIEIQTQLANSDSTEAQQKFAAITGNNPIRSVAAGGLGSGVGVSGGSVGGQTNPSTASSGSSSSFQAFTSNSVSNNPGSYFSASVSSASSSGSTTTTTTTIKVCTVSTTC
ncbi:hypothetical protein NLM33_17720 [Bradyrhizobium sp. CCGUVB1N3]|uniref:hypothetical protein n=1 Tax=Bradyrhizobium sp. CCGUVB1N3 TaxID=2949629 RepID=UPI0020B22E76|nr:hypothetical protein [Bradyrhizobium sp. CCGUVB1N3]MCP3472155.1 hypothetical protein [Bradyrhizobium sp. CCGUVB1N3]